MTTNSETDGWLAAHEAGHAVVGFLVGHRPGPVTIEPGRSFGGCAWTFPPALRSLDLERIQGWTPAPLLPDSVRRLLEGDLMVSAAGNVAAELHVRQLALPPTGRRPAGLIARLEPRAEADIALSPAEDRMVAEARAEDELPGGTDDDHIWRAAMVLNANDATAALQHATWLATVTGSLLQRNWHRVDSLAHSLLKFRTLGGAAVSEIIDSARRP